MPHMTRSAPTPRLDSHRLPPNNFLRELPAELLTPNLASHEARPDDDFGTWHVVAKCLSQTFARRAIVEVGHGSARSELCGYERTID